MPYHQILDVPFRASDHGGSKRFPAAALGTQRTKNPKKIETNFYAIWLDIELK